MRNRLVQARDKCLGRPTASRSDRIATRGPILACAASMRIDGAVLSEEAFLVRLFGERAERLLVLVAI